MLTSSYEESRWSPVQKLASSTLKPEASLNHGSRRRAALPKNNEAGQLEKWKMD